MFGIYHMGHWFRRARKCPVQLVILFCRQISPAARPHVFPKPIEFPESFATLRWTKPGYQPGKDANNKWQEIADLLARVIDVPAALIMKTENQFMDIYISIGLAPLGPRHLIFMRTIRK